MLRSLALASAPSATWACGGLGHQQLNQSIDGFFAAVSTVVAVGVVLLILAGGAILYASLYEEGKSRLQVFREKDAAFLDRIDDAEEALVEKLRWTSPPPAPRRIYTSSVKVLRAADRDRGAPAIRVVMR